MARAPITPTTRCRGPTDARGNASGLAPPGALAVVADTRLTPAVRLFALSVLRAAVASAQPASETGRITDVVVDAETGDRLIGRNVWLVRTPCGAAADFEGRYIIEAVPSGAHLLRTSYVEWAPALRMVELLGRPIICFDAPGLPPSP